MRLSFRKDTLANWEAANPVLAAGEPGYVIDTGMLRIGNGVTAFADLDDIGAGGGQTLLVDEQNVQFDFTTHGNAYYGSWGLILPEHDPCNGYKVRMVFDVIDDQYNYNVRDNGCGVIFGINEDDISQHVDSWSWEVWSYGVIMCPLGTGTPSYERSAYGVGGFDTADTDTLKKLVIELDIKILTYDTNKYQFLSTGHAVFYKNNSGADNVRAVYDFHLHKNGYIDPWTRPNDVAPGPTLINFGIGFDYAYPSDPVDYSWQNDPTKFVNDIKIWTY